MIDLKNLKKLVLDGNAFGEIPELVGKIKSLEHLSVQQTALTKLPEVCLVVLVCRRRMRKALTPPIPANCSQSICDLSNMTEFHCTSNRITHLPKRFGDLKKLTILHCWDNSLVHFPRSFGQLDSLKEVHAYKNRMKWMPQCMGDLKSIVLLRFEGNRIKKLPQSLVKLTTIENLGARFNKLVSQLV